MSTRQNVDLYSVPITSKPVYWEIVHDSPCFWFWFCLALVCLYAILITGLDLTLTINYPPALWFCYLASDLRLNKCYDSAWSWSASGSLHRTLKIWHLSLSTINVWNRVSLKKPSRDIWNDENMKLIMKYQVLLSSWEEFHSSGSFNSTQNAAGGITAVQCLEFLWISVFFISYNSFSVGYFSQFKKKTPQYLPK